MSQLVGSCGFASLETTSDALGKYGSAEELALIRTLGTGEQAYTNPIAPLFRVGVGVSVAAGRGVIPNVARTVNRVIEGPVKSKEDLDSFSISLICRTRSPSEQLRRVYMEQNTGIAPWRSVVRRDWSERSRSNIAT